MLTAVAALLALILVATVVSTALLLRALNRESDSLDMLTTEVEALRLKARTRITQAKVRNGVRDEESLELVRLGRASAGRRRVFGGEEDAVHTRSLQNGSLRGQE
jgi:hypothetical protein